MFYHAVTDIHYGLKASASGRDGESQDLPQVGVPGFRNMRAGAVRVDRKLGQGGAWRQGCRAAAARPPPGKRAGAGGVAAFPGSAARVRLAQLATGPGTPDGRSRWGQRGGDCAPWAEHGAGGAVTDYGRAATPVGAVGYSP